MYKGSTKCSNMLSKMLVAVLFGLTRFGLNKKGLFIALKKLKNHKKFNVSSNKVLLPAYSIKGTGKFEGFCLQSTFFEDAYQRYVNFLNDKPTHSVNFKPGQEDKVRAFWFDKR